MARSNVSPEDWAAMNAAAKTLGAPGDDWKPPVEVQVAWRAAWALDLLEAERVRIENARREKDVAALDVVIARLTVGPSAKRVVCLDTESDDAMRAAVAECIRRCAEPLARGAWDEKRAAGQLVVLLGALGVKATAGQAGAMLRAWLDGPASEADKLTPCVRREVVLASGSAEPGKGEWLWRAMGWEPAGTKEGA